MKSSPRKINSDSKNSIKKILISRTKNFNKFTERCLKKVKNYTTKDFFKYCKFRKKYLNETNKSISNYYEDIIERNTKFLSSFKY